jgi:hypothetical protein
MKLRMSAASVSRKKRGVPAFIFEIRVICGSILERDFVESVTTASITMSCGFIGIASRS